MVVLNDDEFRKWFDLVKGAVQLRMRSNATNSVCEPLAKHEDW